MGKIKSSVLNFQSIPGLSEVKSQLIGSVKDGMVAHALLFQGKPGALSLPLALAYAGYLHCENRGADACGQCAACVLTKKHIHPDTHFAYPVGNMKTDMKENDESVLRSEILKLWRSFLFENQFGSAADWIAHYGGEDKQPIISREEGREIIKSLSLKPFQSKYKVMIIWQPEMMHSSAANGLLKILEEPPANTVFILVSERAEQLLPTIISRTQKVTVPLLSDDEIIAELLNLKIAKNKAESITALAEGNLSHALKLIDEEDPHYHEVFSDWMRSCFKSEFGKLVSMADEFHDKDRLYQRSFLQYALGMIRETLLSISGAQSLHRTRGGEREFIEKFKSVFTLKKLEASYQLLTDASYFLERNGSAKMIFTDLSIQFSKVLKG
jgi:DNA polymerase III subunit delta'